MVQDKPASLLLRWLKDYRDARGVRRLMIPLPRESKSLTSLKFGKCPVNANPVSARRNDTSRQNVGQPRREAATISGEDLEQ